jgi:two-component system, NarL family, sensor histidine kinase DegS
MIESINIDIGEINGIIKKIIGQINNSREQILSIVDNVRNDFENLRMELAEIKIEINKVIEEVDALEKQDKIMRKKLAEVSGNFKIYNEKDIKAVYDKASDIRIRFITKTNEEKILKDRRYKLEIALKKASENIDNAEKIVNQISIALRYLEGDILSVLEGADKNSQMFVGIKILEAQEEERKRISRDIHDGPAQYMSNIVMKADICSKIIQKDVNEGLKELADLKESVKSALKEVRGIIFDLRPMSLDDLGLNQTISGIVKSIIEEAGISVQMRLKPINDKVEGIIQVAVYRIIQEILNNIRKHSKAKNVELKMDFGTKYLSLIISDDGIGFNVEETLKRIKARASSYGLISILDRVKQLQGQVHIESSEGVGTVYSIKLPINQEVIKDEKRGN